MTAWTFGYEGFEAETQGLREALLAVGNGNVCLRGAEPEATAGEIHYPGTYLAGVYDRQSTRKLDRTIENEDLVNLPNPLGFTVQTPGEPPFRPTEAELLDYEKHLDLETAVLTRRVRFRDDQDRVTELVNNRFASMANRHRVAQRLVLRPENWSGPARIEASIDGTVRNRNVDRYRDLADQHLDPLATDRPDAETIRLTTRTLQSKTRVALASRVQAFRRDNPVQLEFETRSDPAHVRQGFELDVEEDEHVVVEKTTSIHTSRDVATNEPAYDAARDLEQAPRFVPAVGAHATRWRHLWGRFELDLDVSPPADPQRVNRRLRLHLLHLLQTASFRTIDIDVGVPARGWHGEAYRGHVFWDELFILPTLTLHVPQIARSALLYRYRRLDEARRRARRQGYRGAMFPWQSGSNGEEESQELHLNPRSGRWIPDNTHLQRHVNAAIAYNVYHYYHVTGDLEFLSLYGAELLLSIARFWASFAHYDDRRDRYVIEGVVGPDEYHTSYPWRHEPGLANNAYTNVMAAWCLERALAVLDTVPVDRRAELAEILQLTHDELDRWEEISRNLYVPMWDDGLIDQFEGYQRLEEFPWEAYRDRYDDIQRLDRILEAEDDTTDRYKASKQPDVLMLFHLFSPQRLASLFDRLGYDFDPEHHIPRNVDYYLERTSHGSTLSYFLHAWVSASIAPDRSWRLFQRALDADVEDVQGGTTAEGIHLGSMTGAVDLVQRGYTGLSVAEDVLRFDPNFPDPLDEVSVELRYRGHLLEADVREDQVSVASHASGGSPVSIAFAGDQRPITSGDRITFTR